MHVVCARAGTYELEHLEVVEGVPIVDLSSQRKREKYRGGPKTRYRVGSCRIGSDIGYNANAEGR